MIDDLGGIDDAINYAANAADLQKGEYDVKVVPAPHTLVDLLAGGGDTDEMQSKLPFAPNMTLSADSLLRALPASTRALVGRQILMMQMLEARPVMLVCPYTITVK